MKIKILFVCSFMFLMLKGKSQIDLSSFKLDIPSDSVTGCYCKQELKIIVGSANIIDGLKCKINEFDFLVGLDNRKKIIYYSTRDSNFLINDIKYLTRNRNILDSLRKDSIIYEPGSGAYIKLGQEWNLGFDWKDVSYKKSKVSLKANAFPTILFKRSINYNSSSKWTREYGGKKTTSY
jgi:hypothetical protein